MAIARLIKEISKAEANDLVHVFVDNSNITIEGKYTIAELENLGSFDCERDSRYFNQLRIDYGRLLTTVQCGHKLGCAPVIVGPRPPPNDSIWRRVQEQGYEATVFDRNPIPHHESNWFWTSGMSSKPKSKTHFYSLDDCYRSFAYGLGPDPTGEMKVLEITDGEIKVGRTKI
ncbi:hypothetical protein C2G38_2252099 [Gigaspora rosea]|uniref:Uncharacterized protein n=1 Tax=Gigaspora rosea TaxID=44941 RepID=A0A397UGW9_9GLOM|nr:hypothetical protein C2G38_2252099 [Gigaspora rosea]